MHYQQVKIYYDTEFQTQLDILSENSLIQPSDVNGIANDQNRTIFCLLVFYNFLIHLFYYYKGGLFHRNHNLSDDEIRDFHRQLVPFNQIKNTYGYVDPYRYIVVPLQDRYININKLRNTADVVFEVCVKKTKNFMSNKNYDSKNFFKELLEDEDIRIGDNLSNFSPIYNSLKLQVQKTIFENGDNHQQTNENNNDNQTNNNDENNENQQTENDNQNNQNDNINPYLLTINIILDQGSFTTSYKFALLRALADCAKGTDLEINLRNRNNIPLDWLAEKFVEYYWDLEMSYKIKEKNYVMKEIKKVCDRLHQNQGATLRNFKEQFHDEYNRLLARVRAKAFKDVIRRLHNKVPDEMCSKLFTYDDLGEERLGDEIFISTQAKEFLISHHAVIRNLSLGSWVKFTEKTTNSPRLYKKISGETPRESLNGFYTFLENDRHQNSCFYCHIELLTGQYACDHVIPWSFILEDKAWNLVMCCSTCNSQKSDKIPPIDYIEELEIQNSRLFNNRETLFNNQAKKDFSEWQSFNDLKTHFNNMLNQCRSEGFGDWHR